MNIVVVVIVVVVLLLAVAASARIVKQYEERVMFRLGRMIGERKPGRRVIIPLVEVSPQVSLRIVTMPIQSQGIITRDNVSVDFSAVGSPTSHNGDVEKADSADLAELARWADSSSAEFLAAYAVLTRPLLDPPNGAQNH